MTEHFLTEIEIKEFKCFTDFKASGFKRVNLIGGKNNIGKTAFIEACHISSFSRNINTMITAIYAVKFRREKLNLIFEKIDKQKLLDATKNFSTKSNLGNREFFSIEKDGIKEYNFNINDELKTINAKELNIIIERLSNTIFIDNFGLIDIQLSEIYQIIQKKDLESELNSFIKEFDSSIETFKVIGQKPQCKKNDEYCDINEFGDGLKHYISIICSLYVCENGYLFIDEIDNGIYFNHFDRLWEIILTLSRENNCQVFATTHSKEMLESFARVAEKLDEQDISFTTLIKNKNQEIKTITRDYEMILGSIEDEREVR